jgi:hypothetical protein
MTIVEAEPQHMRALRIANDRRLAGLRLKRDVAAGNTPISVALIDERVSGSLTVAELLGAQRRWGPSRVASCCAALGVSEGRLVRDLTDRQRAVIVEAVT